MLLKNPADKSTQSSIEHENLVQANIQLEDARDDVNDAADRLRAENQRLLALERQQAIEVRRMEQALARANAAQERASRSTASNATNASSTKNSLSTGTKWILSQNILNWSSINSTSPFSNIVYMNSFLT